MCIARFAKIFSCDKRLLWANFWCLSEHLPGLKCASWSIALLQS